MVTPQQFFDCTALEQGGAASINCKLQHFMKLFMKQWINTLQGKTETSIKTLGRFELFLDTGCFLRGDKPLLWLLNNRMEQVTPIIRALYKTEDEEYKNMNSKKRNDYQNEW